MRSSPWLLIEAAAIFLPMLRRACVANAGVDRVARAGFHHCRDYLVVL